MKNQYLALLAAALLGFSLGVAPVHAHDWNHSHHKIKAKVCAMNVETGNSKLTWLDDQYKVAFQFLDTEGSGSRTGYNGWYGGNDWKHDNGSEIHIWSDANNGGKWWCMNEKTYKVRHPHGLTAEISANQPARFEVSQGGDAHTDIVYRLGWDNSAGNDHICVKGDFDGFSQWNSSVSYGKGSC